MNLASGLYFEDVRHRLLRREIPDGFLANVLVVIFGKFEQTLILGKFQAESSMWSVLKKFGSLLLAGTKTPGCCLSQSAK